MKDMKRAIRRHHAARIKRYCERYVRKWSRPDCYLTTWDWGYENGKPIARVVRLAEDWREKYEEWVRKTVQDEASHRPHFCQMCRTPRWNRLKDDRWYNDEEE